MTPSHKEAIRDALFQLNLALQQVYKEPCASRAEVLSRLGHILGDSDLANTAYDYVFLGHLSHSNYLKAKIADKIKLSVAKDSP